MTNRVEALKVEVLNLPKADRARLSRAVASLDDRAARDHAWDAVAARRDAEIEQGLVEALPLDEVLARLRSEVDA